VTSFAPTHTVQQSGLDTRQHPDAAQSPNGRLDPWLDVQVQRWHGDWAEVLCSNGWSAWVDGRGLALMAATAAPAPPPPTPADVPAAAYATQQAWYPADAASAPAPPTWQPAPAAQSAYAFVQNTEVPGYYANLYDQAYAPPAAVAPAGAYGTASYGGYATPAQIALTAAQTTSTTPLKLAPIAIGAVVAFVAGFLPWFSFGQAGSITGFQIPLQFLVSTNVETTGGPTVGLAIVLLAIVGVALSAKPALELFRRAAGGGVVLLATITVGQMQRSLSEAGAGVPDQPTIFSVLSFGLLAAIAGGLLIAIPKTKTSGAHP